jgi:hypothetical protein
MFKSLTEVARAEEQRASRAERKSVQSNSSGSTVYSKASGPRNANPANLGKSAGVSAPKGVSKRKDKRDAKFEVKQIANAVDNYHMTKAYDELVAGEFNSDSLQAANNWIRANQGKIAPDRQIVCHSCGHASIYLCDHKIRKDPEEAVTVEDDRGTAERSVQRVKTYHAMPLSWWERWIQRKTPVYFEISQQNNHHLGDFDNAVITDDVLVEHLYNYITYNMQTSYVVNGKDDRAVRLAHCHRLFMKWGGEHQQSLLKDTVFKNRCLITVQRACDQAETPVIYRYTNPTKNFGLAWFPIFLMALTFLGLIMWLASMMLGDIQLVFNELVANRSLGSTRSSIEDALHGSIQLLRTSTSTVTDWLTDRVADLMNVF